MNNDDLFQKIGDLLAPIRQQLYEQGANVVRLVQGQKRIESHQHQIDTSIGQVKTAVEAVAAGQQDIREDMATKDDIHWLARKLEMQQKRVENLEEETETPNPYKH